LREQKVPQKITANVEFSAGKGENVR
jgi:hypothetical protein